VQETYGGSVWRTQPLSSTFLTHHTTPEQHRPSNQQTSHATYYDFTFRLLTFCHMPKSSLLQRLYAASLHACPQCRPEMLLAFKICCRTLNMFVVIKSNHRGFLQFLVRLLCSHTLNAHILRRKYPPSYLFLNGSHFT
jgi:hypothetical protein